MDKLLYIALLLFNEREWDCYMEMLLVGFTPEESIRLEILKFLKLNCKNKYILWLKKKKKKENQTKLEKTKSHHII